MEQETYRRCEKALRLENPRLAKEAAHQNVLAKLCCAGASKQSAS